MNRLFPLIVINRENMCKKIFIAALLVLVTFSLASCGSDEPQWADPEAHEKTEQLRAQYGPFIVGTWHYEKDAQRARLEWKHSQIPSFSIK